MLKKAINFFYKFAIDYPDWIPEKHKRKLDGIDFIQKDPRLVDFKVPVEDRLDSPTTNEKEFMHEIKYQFDMIYNQLSPVYLRHEIIRVDKNDKTAQELDKLLSLVKEFKFKVDNQNYFMKVLRNNEIQIGHGKPKFSRFYNNTISKYKILVGNYKSLFDGDINNILKFEELSGHKEWMNRVKEKKLIVDYILYLAQNILIY
ncbi:MAG: hypothetical protein ACOYMA_00595 [Bacteroidia bacterium]